MKLSSFLAQTPPAARITLADVGSAGGLKDRWRAARAIVDGILFEPREDGQVRREGSDTIYPLGLGAAAGRADLHITSLLNMSSVLAPNRAVLRAYRKKGGHTEVTARLSIPIDTLDAVAARDGKRIDALKVDTQGSELDILKGADGCLTRTVILAEVEVSFFQRYVGQPVAAEIIAFMHDRGFELIDFYRLKRYRAINSAGIGNISLGMGQRAGRLAYGDALFVLSDAQVDARIAAATPAEAEAIVLRLIAMLLVYGKPDLAAAQFDRLQAHLSPPEQARVGRFLKSMGGRTLRRGAVHHALDYLARHV